MVEHVSILISVGIQRWIDITFIQDSYTNNRTVT